MHQEAAGDENEQYSWHEQNATKVPYMYNDELAAAGGGGSGAMPLFSVTQAVSEGYGLGGGGGRHDRAGPGMGVRGLDSVRHGGDVGVHRDSYAASTLASAISISHLLTTYTITSAPRLLPHVTHLYPLRRHHLVTQLPPNAFTGRPPPLPRTETFRADSTHGSRRASPSFASQCQR